MRLNGCCEQNKQDDGLCPLSGWVHSLRAVGSLVEFVARKQLIMLISGIGNQMACLVCAGEMQNSVSSLSAGYQGSVEPCCHKGSGFVISPVLHPQYLLLRHAQNPLHAEPTLADRIVHLGRVEMFAGVVSALTVGGLVMAGVQDPVALALAGLVSEKGPFYFDGIWQEHHRNPEASWRHLLSQGARNMVPTLGADLLVHDPVYTGLTYLGLNSGWFDGGWASMLLSAGAFGVGVVAAAVAQHVVAKVFNTKF